MPIYALYISHSWRYADAYERLTHMLRARPDMDFRNLTLPSHTPVADARTAQALDQALEDKISRCSVVLIMAGVYSTYSLWINKEIAVAKRLGKPIIAVKPWGAERISMQVRRAAQEECSWNTDNIARAIARWS